MFFGKKISVIKDEGRIDELLTRGIENIFPNKDFVRSKMLKGERLTVYLGLDPTGPNLHLGHVIPIVKLGKLQKLGHQVIFLIGDFTAMIGDPTDKNATRKKLSKEEVLKNLKEYQRQASKFISFSGQNKALLRFNSEWLGKMNFSDVIELTSLVTVDQMLKRDMFQKRIEEEKPIFIHEFLYPLLQGYDSVAMGVDGEIGGNDQTFNMLTGRDLLKTLKNKEKFVIATKLLTDSSGKKMGKTENNMVSLDQTPEDMFGKVMSWSDELIIPGFEIITDVPLSDIESMKEDLNSGKNPKDLKMYLAREIVALCHGEKQADLAKESFDNTFSKGGVPEDMITVTVSKDSLLVDILMVQQLVISKTEFRRLVSEGAITNVDKNKKVESVEEKVDSGVYKVGKRRFINIKVI